MIAPSAMQAPRWASRSPFTAARTRTRVALGEDMSHPTWTEPSQVVAIARRVLADLMTRARLPGVLTGRLAERSRPLYTEHGFSWSDRRKARLVTPP